MPPISPLRPIRLISPLLLTLLTLNLGPWTCSAATIIGNLSDISLQPLDTRISFAPTNQVLVTGSGLSVGPPRILQSTSGSFSIPLDAGDYTVSLPLLGWRKPFIVTVPNTNGTINITNLTISYPQLDHPLSHANAGTVIAWSTITSSSLLDRPISFSPNTLRPGQLFVIEAFGSFSDPGANGPSVTFTIRFGSTTVLTQTASIQSGNWHLSGLVTVRSGGVIAGALAISQDNSSPYLFPFATQTATVDTTVTQSLDLLASIQNFSGAEAVICEQLLIKSE